MAATAADRMVESLLEWGVDIVFGLPGDGINGIMDSLRQRQDRIRFVQVRHEETAPLMACGYARLTGRLGVCLPTSGPGASHLLNGRYDAHLRGAPPALSQTRSSGRRPRSWRKAGRFAFSPAGARWMTAPNWRRLRSGSRRLLQRRCLGKRRLRTCTPIAPEG